MKISKSKKIEELMAKTFELNAEARKIEKEKKQLREELIAQMKESALSCGDYVAVLTDMERESIDKKSLVADQGRDFLEPYLKVTSYQKLEVKKAS